MLRIPRAITTHDWPRELLSLRAAVSAADDDLDRVLDLVLASALTLVDGADGGEVELLDGGSLVCRALSGLSPKTLGGRSKIFGGLSAFCAISGTGRTRGAAITLNASITAPITFDDQQIGVIRLHSLTPDGFTDGDLMALQLIAGYAVIGMARAAFAREERARAEADRRFRATFDQAAVGIAHVAPDGRFILVNDRFCEIVGHERDALIAGGFQYITHPEDLDADLAHVGDLIHGRTASYSMEKRYLRAEGTTVWVNLTVSLVRQPDGTPDFFVSVIEDISARLAAETDAEHDPLTALLNRRGALRRLESVVGPEGLWREGLAVAYLDLDGFKRVNDEFGHQEGDRCLIKVATALRKSLRGDDMVARLGGDEFLAIIPAASELDLEHLLDRVRTNVAAVSEGEKWSVSASVGVIVVGPECRVSAQTLVEAADSLMYRAKHTDSDQPVVSILRAAA
jgi:diguanylate cyclase (GGDEF)-like protein/PAS domain S-box-containing protein